MTSKLGPFASAEFRGGKKEWLRFDPVTPLFGMRTECGGGLVAVEPSNGPL